ncbi:MAG: DUF1080 domain-containing protein [Acidobacteriota bacterium]|nr:DUF1080 domain-containing protein [Acidobacteriota bacterium]
MPFRSISASMLLAAAALAQAPAHKDRSLGYDDTPFLPGGKWRVHDVNRPRPEVITPGTAGSPPSDAIVLFDGTDLSKWVTNIKGQPTEPKWKVQDGYVEVVDGTGAMNTREKFGDIQLHVEWAAPTNIEGTSQDRGNSGILLMGRYEIQVLDSYQNPTYADGQAAAIYGQFPPPVNASRKPGEWQTYDIVFEAPKFDGGKLMKPAFVTVFQNDVVMHNRQELLGDTPHAKLGTYKPHAAEEPLQLQNHHTAVRYRNIWVRRLNGAEHVEIAR